MASFDFIDAATRGYAFLWRERAAIVRMAVPLFILKYVAYVFVMALSLETNMLRQGLIYLPAYFVEGWLMAQLIRQEMFGERWPVARTPANEEALAGRVRAIKAGIIIFVLIKLVVTAVSGMYVAGTPAPDAELPPPTLGMFLAAVIAFSAMIWSFRLLWLHIPAVIGYSPAEFLHKAGGFMTSVYMIGVWMVCKLPIFVAAVVLSEGIANALGNHQAVRMLLIGVQVAVEIMISVIATIGMTHAVHAILSRSGKDKK